jgi:hypothetical protein
MSRREIAAELKRRGLTTYIRKPWRVQQISRMLALKDQTLLSGR